VGISDGLKKTSDVLPIIVVVVVSGSGMDFALKPAKKASFGFHCVESKAKRSASRISASSCFLRRRKIVSFCHVCGGFLQFIRAMQENKISSEEIGKRRQNVPKADKCCDAIRVSILHARAESCQHRNVDSSAAASLPSISLQPL
jgi:hypothetical protein